MANRFQEGTDHGHLTPATAKLEPLGVAIALFNPASDDQSALIQGNPTFCPHYLEHRGRHAGGLGGATFHNPNDATFKLHHK